ncbi:hypothetical protein ARMGADRAFT_1080405 [Armillaria gallica]|uniref:Uncharacterized protein n=1 Tax=Armillaria gallica TaxID=47427 RepID=A0A2H3DP60_ARMGA|nr:hypothetical protein ARMGADRAFT_1080405 [Armillaria gallica]
MACADADFVPYMLVLADVIAFLMATLSCIIVDERYSYSIALQWSNSHCSTVVHVSDGGLTELRVSTGLFVHSCTLELEVKEDLPTDVVLGHDWFQSFADLACEHQYAS